MIGSCTKNRGRCGTTKMTALATTERQDGGDETGSPLQEEQV
jgi:hypothetical protein